MNKIIACVLFVFLPAVLTLPSTFDFRVQPSLIKYADYTFKPEGTCIAHAWGLQLAQALSNSASLILKDKVRLSSQHLIQCVSSKNQICHDASLQNIHNAIDYISKHGLSRVGCVKNRLFQKPSQFCPKYCDNGSEFDYSPIRGKIVKHTSFNDFLTQLTSDEITSGFLIVKVFNSMNYYSSQNPSPLQNTDGQNFQYRVGQIVGWKNKGNDIVVRLGSGQGWGYNGYANLNQIKHKQIIVEMYTLKADVQPAVRIKTDKLQEAQY